MRKALHSRNRTPSSSTLSGSLIAQFRKTLDIIKTGGHERLAEILHRAVIEEPDLSTMPYRHKLIEELSSVNSADTIEKLNEVLVGLNFNYRPYLLYRIEDFGNMLRSTQEDVSEVLRMEIKKIRQLIIDPLCFFHKTYPSVVDVLENWLSEEYYFIKTDGRHEYPAEQSSGKISVDLSAAQLACLLKALVESKIIQQTNVTDLTEMVARNFETKRSDRLSAGSLRRKYYNVEFSTQEYVIALLKKMTDSLRAQV